MYRCLRLGTAAGDRQRPNRFTHLCAECCTMLRSSHAKRQATIVSRPVGFYLGREAAGMQRNNSAVPADGPCAKPFWKSCFNPGQD